MMQSAYFTGKYRLSMELIEVKDFNLLSGMLESKLLIRSEISQFKFPPPFVHFLLSRIQLIMN